MTQTTTKEESLNGHELYLTEFSRLEECERATAPPWLAELRRRAIEHFTQMGFPTLRDEGWRQTSLAPLLRQSFTGSSEVDVEGARDAAASYLFPQLTAHVVAFINGRYAPEISTVGKLPEGVRVMNLGRALSDDSTAVATHLGRHAPHQSQAFVALNTALHRDGAYIHVGRDLTLEEPIHLLFFSTSGGGAPTHDHVRNLIVLEQNARATVIESYAGQKGEVYFSTAVTETVMAEGSHLDHYVVQEESTRAYHYMRHHVHQARASRFSTHTISLGGALARNEISPVLDGDRIESTLNGLYMLTGSQHLDNNTMFDHAKPHCNSTQVYKGILDGNARAVFTGKIMVRQDAQKTDAVQSSKNLLLSETAQVNAQPQLEIFADDVRCTHGATIGQLDADALFYLRSRGIDRETARGLLTFAFANEIIEKIKIKPLREKLERLAARRFRKNSATEDAK